MGCATVAQAASEHAQSTKRIRRIPPLRHVRRSGYDEVMPPERPDHASAQGVEVESASMTQYVVDVRGTKAGLRAVFSLDFFRH